jgi:hypothetical protein
MWVDLSENELRVARMVAVERQLYGRKNYEDKKKMDDGFQADVDGMVAEMCFGKLFNYYVDMGLGKKKADFVSRKGETIDVKSTRYKTGKLLATLDKKNDPCDLYVLMVIDDEGGWYKGYVSKEELFKDENIKDLGHGPTYVYEIR